jgi:hypothetical protein
VVLLDAHLRTFVDSPVRLLKMQVRLHHKRVLNHLLNAVLVTRHRRHKDRILVHVDTYPLVLRVLARNVLRSHCKYSPGPHQVVTFLQVWIFGVLGRLRELKRRGSLLSRQDQTWVCLHHLL